MIIVLLCVACSMHELQGQEGVVPQEKIKQHVIVANTTVIIPQPLFVNTTMNDLSLTLILDKRQIHSGQSLYAHVELTNASTQLLHVQQPYGVEAPPLFFTFRTSPTGGIRYQLSREELHASLLGHDTPMPIEPEFVEVKPGESLSTKEDLGELTLNPIASGHYYVRAEWRQPGLTGESNFVKLEIIEPTLWEQITAWFCWWC